MVKAVLAVLAGFAMMGVVAVGMDALFSQLLPGQFNSAEAVRGTGVLTVTLAYTLFACALGGYATAWIAKERGMGAAWALGALIAAATIANLVMSPSGLPLWWKLAGGALCGPFTVLGGWLKAETRQ